MQTSQTLGNRNELLQMPYLIYHQFPNETVSGKVSLSCYLLCRANSLYIAQQKVVPWEDMPDESVFDWDCQIFGHLSFFCCANFLDIGQDKGVKWQGISDISIFEWDLCEAFVQFPVVYWSILSAIGQQEGVTSKKINFLMILCQILNYFPVVYMCKLFRH